MSWILSFRVEIDLWSFNPETRRAKQGFSANAPLLLELDKSLLRNFEKDTHIAPYHPQESVMQHTIRFRWLERWQPWSWKLKQSRTTPASLTSWRTLFAFVIFLLPLHSDFINKSWASLGRRVVWLFVFGDVDGFTFLPPKRFHFLFGSSRPLFGFRTKAAVQLCSYLSFSKGTDCLGLDQTRNFPLKKKAETEEGHSKLLPGCRRSAASIQTETSCNLEPESRCWIENFRG